MFGRSRKTPHWAFEKRLGYVFRNKDLLETALVHRSFRFERAGVESDNQRLEFLGDAVLGLVAAVHMYRDFQDGDEGTLTHLRSRITSGKALSKIAASVGLGDEIKVGKGEERSGGRRRASNLADALEAVIGAAYLDGGIEAVEKLFHKLFLPELKACGLDMWAENPKGKLQELSQRVWNSGPRYRKLREEGPSHAKFFTVEVFLNGAPAGRGKGTSKQEAEVNAAISALKKLAKKD